MSIWDSYLLEDNKVGFYHIGLLQLWIKKNLQEWITGWKYNRENPQGISMTILDSCDDETIGWQRKVVKAPDSRVMVSPMMPDRAVVVKLDSAVQITAGAEALCYVSIPMWINVFYGEDSQGLLYEIPTVKLSNTWFGEPHSGLLCYSLKSSTSFSLTEIKPKSYEIICPVQIKNTTSLDLDFTKLCIQTDYLNIYESNNEMWTNPIHVHFRGVDKESTVTYENTNPQSNREFTLIAKSRKKYSKTFTGTRKSFDTFKIYN